GQLSPVASDPPVIGQARIAAQVRVTHHGRLELAGGAIEARTQDRLARLVERPRRANARRDVFPRERRVVPAERDAGDDVRECGVRLRLAWKRGAPLTVVAQPRVDCQPSARDRVAQVRAEELEAVRAQALAIHARDVVRRGVVQRADHVARPPRAGRRVDTTITAAELDLVRRAPRVVERSAIEVGRVLRTVVQALTRRPARVGWVSAIYSLSS